MDTCWSSAVLDTFVAFIVTTQVLWGMTTCSLVKVYQRFRRRGCLYN